MKLLWKLVLVVAIICCLPIVALTGYVWYGDYRESRNSFTIGDICKIKKGMDIETAENLLDNPVTYQNYNWSNVFSAQYRDLKRNYFLEIIYRADDDVIEEIYWTRGRTKTLTQSGVCTR